MVGRFFKSAVVVAGIVAVILLLAALLAASHMEGSVSLPLSILIVECARVIWNRRHGSLAAFRNIAPKR